MAIHVGRRPRHTTLPLDLVGRLADRVFRQADAEARLNGLTIVRTHRGSRVYRHPLFDRFAECTGCAGEGRSAGEPCTRCVGTGRITLRQATNSPLDSAWPKRSIGTPGSTPTIEEAHR